MAGPRHRGIDRPDIKDVVRQYEKGVNEGDMELLLSLFTEDATFNDSIGLLESFDGATVPGEEALPRSSSVGRV